MRYVNESLVGIKDGLKSVTSLKVYYLKAASRGCPFFNFCYCFFKADPIMQGLHQT